MWAGKGPKESPKAIINLKKLGLAATRFEIELCMAKDDSWMLSLH